MKVSVIFDNLAEEGYIPAWGFSAFIETSKGERVLFDTGNSCRVWEHNASKLGIDYESFDHILLSHFHWDHIGGALDIAYFSRRKKHFLTTDGFSKVFVTEIVKNGHQVSLVREPYRFSENLLSLGALKTNIGNLYEHSLLVFENGNYILVVGCSHPGILNIARRAISLTGKPPRLIIGGFHFLGMDEITITAIAEELLELGVDFVAPCHCTGEPGREIFASVFGNRYIEVKAGTVIEL